MAPSRGSFTRRAVATAQDLVARTGFEVTRDRFRHRFVHLLTTHGIDQTLDIGANVGQFALALRRGGYRGTIVSLEPLSAPFTRLRAAAERDQGWTALRAAVGAEAGMLTVNVSQNDASSSVLPVLPSSTEAAPVTQHVGAEQVRATTVDDLVAEHGIRPERALLKVDVQGYEAAVFSGAADTLRRFAAVRTEMSLVPLYDGQSLMAETMDFLAGHGFELWHVEPGFTDPRTRRLLQLDGVFLRSA